MTKSQRKKTWFSLFFKALFPRFLFLGHGMFCIFLIVEQEEEEKYWYLTFCLGVLVLEGIFNVIVREGKEFHWFCPSAFLYCVVLVVTLTLLREGQLKCFTDTSHCERKLKGNALSELLNRWNFNKRASIIEQTGLLVLIVGRWLLPQGSISKEQFCQILLIYIGTAADIVEFSEIYNEDVTNQLKSDTESVLHGIMAVWSLSVVQFSLTIALPEEGLKEDVDDDEEDEDEFEHISYFRSKLRNKVAPMSYMHYKSLLREGINERNGTIQSTQSVGTPSTLRTPSMLRTQNIRSPGPTPQVFRNKYPIFANANTSMRSKPAGLEPLESPRERADTNPPILHQRKSGMTNKDSSTSLNRRSNTMFSSTSSTSSKISMPHGGRTPKNIGSPLNSVKSGKISSSKISLGGNKPITTPQSIRSNKIKSPNSIRSTKESANSQQQKNNISSNSGELSPEQIKTWDRLLERIPFSKKRRRMNRTRKDSTKEDNSLGIGKKEVKGCFYKYIDLIGILLPVCMQDGPFFIIRFVLVSRYGVMTEMMMLLVTKNALVIIVQIYRIFLMYCSEPKTEETTDMDEASLRVRAAMNTNQKLSGRGSFRTKRASIAVQALTRMQARIFGKENQQNSRQSRQKNGDIEMG